MLTDNVEQSTQLPAYFSRFVIKVKISFIVRITKHNFVLIVFGLITRDNLFMVNNCLILRATHIN